MSLLSDFSFRKSRNAEGGLEALQSDRQHVNILTSKNFGFQRKKATRAKEILAYDLLFSHKCPSKPMDLDGGPLIVAGCGWLWLSKFCL
jgi:hypothetical protein